MRSSSHKHSASIKHLSADKYLGAFIRGYGPLTFRREHTQEPFAALCESIIYQQISGGAAASILKRFKALWPPTSRKATRGKAENFPTPKQVLKIKVEKLRTAGVSPQKAAYLKDLAAKFDDGTIDPSRFDTMSDEEIIEHVTAVKGVGEWTAQMFLMFTLGRPDVLPTGDLGIQKAFKKVFNLHATPSPAKMESLARGWVGHRTVACFYLWRMLDTD